jgi:extradiol dioxygenase family protein
MAAKTLPASEQTRGDFRNWVAKEAVGHQGVAHIKNPAADQDYDQYDMCVSLPWCGLVDNGVDTGDDFSMYVAEGIQIDSREIETGADFDTFGEEVWYNPTTKEYTTVESADVYLVGYVILPVDSEGCFRFEKRRYVVEGEDT